MNRSSEHCLHHLFERQAAATPDRPAAVFEKQTLTYSELLQRANLVARRLAERNVGPESVVALFVERSLDMIAGVLGILMSGAAYLPLEVPSPDDRTAFMLDDARVDTILTQGHLTGRLPDPSRAICFESFDWSEHAEKVESAVRPDNLAYVIYTSGSTGRPKGVCIEHRNIVSYVEAIVDRLELEPGMNHATVSTIAADLGNTVVFPALVTGGCLHVISHERAESQPLLSDYFRRNAIDVLKIVPSHLAALQTGNNPDAVMPRRRLILGGESSRIEWIQRLRALAPECRIFNHYGPTETTVGVLTYRVGTEMPATASGTVPLGSSLPNARTYVVTGTGELAAAGETGELYIGGNAVGRGYLNRPELTAERFVSGRFGTDPSARVYRTGDLVRQLADGTVEFLGRADDQVKLFGNRIELGEITSALRAHPGVRDAVVLAPDTAGEKQLAAYVIPNETAQPLWGNSALHVLPDGSAVAHLNRSETDYIYNEIFVLQAYLRHGITIADGDCIIDAGANIGLFTLFANRMAEDLRTIAFEPSPATFACLKANAEAWCTNVKCLPVGLSSENKTAEMTFFEGFSLLSGFYADSKTEGDVVRNYVLNQQPDAHAEKGFDTELGTLIEDRLHAKTITAQLRRLSDVIAEQRISRIDLLKVNVEKSELDVLRGIDPGDWSKIRQLVIEVDQSAHIQPITEILERYGFEFVVEQDPLLRKTELCYVYAVRPSAGRRLNADNSAASIRPVPPPAAAVLTPVTLRRHLQERLPRFMIPSAFVLLDRFPLTANGKVDRTALLALAAIQPKAAADVHQPRTNTEKRLAQLWSELLNVPAVGINDDFFDLGGQSLVAIKTVSRIRDLFSVDIALRNLFEKPTVAGLAELIDGLKFVTHSDRKGATRSKREEIAL